MDNQDNQREAVLYAYLAGIIDGEGTVRIGHGNTGNKYYAAIGVGMSSKPIVELLRNTFTPDGTIWIERVPNRKTIYRWGTSGNKVVPKILDKILPHLLEKKEQAILLKQFCEPQEWYGARTFNKKTNRYNTSEKELQRREELYLKVKKLNAVGALATTK